MLYLPPRWGHDGVAEGECMTCSIGFRAPAPASWRATAAALAERSTARRRADALYRDPRSPRPRTPARVPPALQPSRARVARALRDRRCARARARRGAHRAEAAGVVRAGAALSPAACGAGARPAHAHDVRRAPRLHQRRGVPGGGARCALMRRLADRAACAADVAPEPEAPRLLDEWARAGWLRVHRAGGLSRDGPNRRSQ